MMMKILSPLSLEFDLLLRMIGKAKGKAKWKAWTSITAAGAAASNGPDRSSFFRLIATLRFKRLRRHSSRIGSDGGNGGDDSEKKPVCMLVRGASTRVCAS